MVQLDYSAKNTEKQLGPLSSEIPMNYVEEHMLEIR